MLGQATGNTDSLYSPRLGLGGSNHVPSYIILYVCPWLLHLNGFLSQDSQGGVPKLSRFGLPRLWEVITPSSDLQLGWGLKKTCSSPQELFNGVSHLTCTHQNRVDFQLLVVGSQIGSLTSSPSFNHNLCYKCPNGSCEAIFDIYTLRPFQRYKEHLNTRCFAPTIKFWVFDSPRGLQVPTFGSVNFILTLASKWGCNTGAPGWD
jgi:hypothetical protein